MVTIQKSHFDLKVRDGVFLKDMSWWGQTSEFCMDSSLHGLRYIGQPRRHWFERVFWFIAFCISIAVSTVLILEIWEKYRLTPVITVFQPKDTRINLLPFPAITIGNTNNVQISKAVEFESKILASRVFPEFNVILSRNSRLIANPTDPHANEDLYQINHICQSSITFKDTFNFSLDHASVRKDLIEQIVKFKISKNHAFGSSGVDFAHLLRDVAQKCDDLILLCMWGGDVRKCSDLFDEIETDFGYCCVFNMVPMSLLMNLRNDSRDNQTRINDWESLNLDTDNMILDEEGAFENEYRQKFGTLPRFPRRQRRPGKSTGLSMLLNPDKEGYFCTNTDSVGFMAVAHLPFDFPNVADKGIAIKPNTETYLKIEPEIVRAGSEIQAFPLDNRNCYFGKEYSLKYYKYYTMSNCENECIANLTYNECECIRYYMPRSEEQPICGVKKINKNVSILHVHYLTDSTYPKQRKELFGFIDLVSNTGGLLGLCMGFSVLSVMEIIYFFTLRLYCQTRSGRNLGHRVTRMANRMWRKVGQLGSVGKPTNVTTFHFPRGIDDNNFRCHDELRSVNVVKFKKQIEYWGENAGDSVL
ncbi:Pickpocket protein 28 [Folsomia candida]|uniref:Pickpocket protein 28 n=1 Tax=Folsomia candida TaxID=158441 RepID=A0A226EYV0_FOLCA|nr:Pickpocket protein 28 [Folsomia candida]